MRARREIHALDYAICIAVSLLNLVFRGTCQWWRIDRGFNIEIEDLQHTSSMDMYVYVRPVGWRENELIVLRCRRYIEWQVFEAWVQSPRLPDDLTRHVFTCSVEYSKLTGRDTDSEQFLRRVVPDWFKKVS